MMIRKTLFNMLYLVIVAAKEALFALTATCDLENDKQKELFNLATDMYKDIEKSAAEIKRAIDDCDN
jgi:hypothetical protein